MSVIGFILLLTGVGLGVGGLISRSRTQRFVETAVRSHALVTGLEQRRGSKHTVMYHPVLRFKTEAGAQHEVVSPVGSKPSPYKPGHTVPILYNPARPEEVRIHSFLHVWLFPLVLGGMGALFFILGGVLVLMGR